MKSNSKFETVKSVMINLLDLGLPAILIQLYLEISISTFSKYIKNLREEKIWDGKIPSFVEALPRMLRIVCVKYTRCTYLDINYDNIDRKKLYDSLVKILQVEKILMILSYARKHIQKMRLFKFDPAVPSGYVDFLNLFNHSGGDWSPKEGGEESLWFDYLKAFKESEISLNLRFQNEWPDVAINKILEDLTFSVCNDVHPVFTIEIVDRVDKVLSKTLTEREADILKMNYGLGKEKFLIHQIGEYFGLTAERTRQIHHKAIRRCMHESRLKLFFEPYIETPVDVLWENEAKLNSPDILFSSIEDLPKRVTELLKNNFIYSFNELLIYSPQKLWNAHFGKKTLWELNDLLTSHGFNFRYSGILDFYKNGTKLPSEYL